MFHATNQSAKIILSGVFVWLAYASAGVCADAPAAAPVNYAEHVAPILKRHCAECHGETRKKAGLDFSNYEAVLKGGSGGKVVIAGRPSKSRLLEVIVAEDPGERMPLNSDPLTSQQVAVIKNWISEGLRENSGSTSNLPKIVEFTPEDASSANAGPPSLPSNLPAIKRTNVLRPFPVLALTASPRAPLLAVAAYECLDFVDPATQEVMGSVPFAEGEPQVLRFNRSGSMLLAAGGRPVQNGIAALVDVKTGKRLATIGDETDTVIAADLSPDDRRVALGGSGRSVKVFSTQDGSRVHTLVKHTDWVTAIAFSPDGKLLASGDRVGNIYLWDPQSGQVVLPLPDHKGAIRSLTWRADSKVLVSCGEDGLIVWWDVAKGSPMTAQADAHLRPRATGEYGKIAGGVLDAAFGPQGQLVSCGRDHSVRLWGINGEPLKTFSIDKADKQAPQRIRVVPTRVTITNDGKTVVAGDSAGHIHTWAVGAK